MITERTVPYDEARYRQLVGVLAEVIQRMLRDDPELITKIQAAYPEPEVQPQPAAISIQAQIGA